MHFMKSEFFSFMFFVLFMPTSQCSSDPKDYSKLAMNTLSNNDGDTLINREPAVAGSFYPGNREELMKELTALFSAATPFKKLGNIIAVISPHAGYEYSGTVAASAFNQLSPETTYDNVFIIGSSHRSSFEGASIYSTGNFITPLGIARVNLPLARMLIDENPDIFSASRDVHLNEHSLEVQIPFLQYIYKDKLELVPILLGTQNPATCKKIAEALRPWLNGHNLFVISTDFSHYPAYQDARSADENTANAIVKNSAVEFMQAITDNEDRGLPGLATSICGWTSMLTFLDITERNKDIHYHKIRYMNSGDAPIGDKNRVVGYHAMVVTLDAINTDDTTDTASYSLTRHEKDQLLKIARNTIKNYLATGKVLEIYAEGFSDRLLAHSGAFVTLNKEEKLRGCIGQFTADIPLYKVVQQMAIASATRDYRFTPLSAEELGEVNIEISVLTPMRKIQSINEIVLGRHGIYIKKGSKGGTFLPQVATQTGWSFEEFLGHCSRDKADIGWDGWKDADIYVYEAYVFGEL
jgi:MEMO1 family protein